MINKLIDTDTFGICIDTEEWGIGIDLCRNLDCPYSKQTNLLTISFLCLHVCVAW